MKSILVIGMGRFGTHLAERMMELGNDVMIIDRHESIVNELADRFTDAHVGDCTVEAVVRTLGVDKMDICFVSTGENFQSSLVVTSLLKKYGAKYVVAKANQDIQADLLYQIGADEVVYPEREIAEKLAIRHNANNIFDYIQLTDDYSIYEIPVPKSWWGQTLMELDVRKKYRINIIAVKRAESLQPSPGADYVFMRDDHIVVIGKATDVFKVSGGRK